MIQIDDIIEIDLLPSNEADYPEIVKVKVKQKLPIEDKNIFIAQLLTQTKQDFGYQLNELLVVNVKYENNKYFAYSEKSIADG